MISKTKTKINHNSFGAWSQRCRRVIYHGVHGRRRVTDHQQSGAPAKGTKMASSKAKKKKKSHESNETGDKSIHGGLR